jgi:small GTP-binding protein
LTSSFYRYAAATILVFDITDEESFKDIKNHVQSVRNYQRKQPLFLVGNKSDLERDRAVSKGEGHDLAVEVNAAGNFMEVSAKTGKNVDKLFAHVARTLLEQGHSDDDDDEFEVAPKKSKCNVL